MEKVFQR